MKSYKTPLRYPGGKSRAAQKIEAYFPDLREYDEFREPFIGGGSVAIYIAKKFPHLNRLWSVAFLFLLASPRQQRAFWLTSC